MGMGKEERRDAGRLIKTKNLWGKKGPMEIHDLVN